MTLKNRERILLVLPDLSRLLKARFSLASR